MSYESTQVLTGPELPRQNTVRLPPYEELARVADETNEEQNNAQIGSSPATIAYFQTSSSRTSRQSSTERPVFNDPFRGHPPSTSPFQPGNQHMRLPSSTENYTTTSEGRNIFLNTRISPILDHRRSSMRTEYEPRAPPALFPQPRTTSHDSGSPAARPSYYPPTALSHAHQVPASPQETRRASEAHFSHPGYGVTYNHDPYRQRSWASESPGYPRQYQRHDSTVYAGPEHWYGYPGTYGYNVEGAHADGTGRKRRGNLPKEATNTLKEWFQRHADSPYPTDEEKSDLAGLTGLSSAQISNWFINARRRTPGKEAREAARQNNNRGNQQQAQQQDSGDERARGNHVPQQTHYRQRQPSAFAAQERSRYPPSESHYGNQDDHQDGTQDQVMHDA
ncbi:Homeobox [Botryosphaeria dothidea]|uniref:Homeobox n=1 Tax=Botryosphaeria dothidea TaxID=55169 RepID=A0A8H4J4X9_9PEZI|nr:Homeobox [Botryosphaeria dothidea]